MSDKRYGHTSTSGGDQDEGERKDAGWKSRQGGSQSRSSGRTTSEEPRDQAGQRRESLPPPGSNTQGELAGIGEASRKTAAASPAEEAPARSGTDQPPRMGGPLGADRDRPHLPEGAQDAETRGSGARGFDRGVNAKVVGAVHQGVREEDAPGGS